MDINISISEMGSGCSCSSSTSIDEYTRFDVINSMELFPFNINNLIWEYSEPYMNKIHKKLSKCEDCGYMIKPSCFSCNMNAPDDYCVIITSNNKYFEDDRVIKLEPRSCIRVSGITSCDNKKCIDKLKSLILLDYNSILLATRCITAIFSENHVIHGKMCCLKSRKYAASFQRDTDVIRSRIMSFDLSYFSTITPLKQVYDYFSGAENYYNVLCTCDSTLDRCYYCN